MHPSTARLPAYFISHGGGPWPYVPEMRRAMHVLEASLQDIPRQLGGLKPSLILMISGHWEADVFKVMSAARPPMLYDYRGFPPHTYTVVYPAAGAPGLAPKVRDLIAAAGLPTGLDATRGFDHGVFAPLAVMYPDADVPVLQVSICHGYDPAQHLALGRALAPLRDQGVLIVGSGLSWHNLRMLGPRAREPSAAFDGWLQQTLVDSTPQQRDSQLLAWETAPSARVAHPEEDHLIPLMVAVGAADGDAATCVYHEDNAFGGVTASSFRFGSTLAA